MPGKNVCLQKINAGFQVPVEIDIIEEAVNFQKAEESYQKARQLP